MSPASIAAAAIPTPSGTTLLGNLHAQSMTRLTSPVKMIHVNFTVTYKAYTVPVWIGRLRGSMLVNCSESEPVRDVTQIRAEGQGHVSESSSVQNPDRSRAEAALFSALRGLREAVGSPSVRTIAREVGGVSHTTVHAALTGTTIPTWPVLSKLVTYLGGDETTFRQLWEDARPAGSSSTRRPTPGPEISVFVSYARIDDKASYNRISQLIDGIAATYESATGKTVGVFKDVESIKPGDDWRDRIRLGLSSSSILLAFISPAYLRSPACREELTEFFAFLRANSSTRLIIPLMFASPDRVLGEFNDDLLWQQLEKLNYLDISNLRFTDPGSGSWIQTLEVVADRIDKVLRDVPDNIGNLPSELTDEDEIDPEGFLERMAEIEDRMPGMESGVKLYGSLMERLGEQLAKATPDMHEADTYAKKLAVSDRVARDITPIADELDAVAGKLVTDLNELTYVTKFVTASVAKSPDSATKDVMDFLNIIKETATTGIKSLSALDVFTQTVNQSLGYSSRLDRPFKKIRSANLKLAELRGIMTGWLEEVDTVLTQCPLSSQG
jgi:hypothetical protein